MKRELFIQLDRLTKNEDVFLLAESNNTLHLELTLLRRQEKGVIMPLPDKSTSLYRNRN